MLKSLLTTIMIVSSFQASAAEEPKDDRLYELRTYHAAPGKLDALLTRFRDHTMAPFKKHGITNLAYFQLTPDQPDAENTLFYFIAHKDKAAATKSWDESRADPEWIEAKMASEKEAMNRWQRTTG